MCDKINNLKKIAVLKEERGSLPTGESGVYKWWCKKEDFDCLLKALGKNFSDVQKYVEYSKEEKLFCFYVGQTKSSFAKRIKGQHLKNTEKSTLRRSVKALFKEENINNFLDKCSLSYTSMGKGQIDMAERKEINNWIRLLNLRDLNDIDKEKDFIDLRNSIVKKLKEKRTTKK